MRAHIDRVSRRWLHSRSALAIVSSLAAFALTASTFGQIATQDDGPTLEDGRRLLQQQDFEGAAKVFEAITVREPKNGQAWHLLGFSRHGGGDLAQALPAHLMAAEFPPPTGPVAMYNVACVYSLWDRPDKAFQWLDRAVAAGFRNQNQLVIDTDMDNIRDDERFRKIMDRLAAPTTRPAAASADSPGGEISGLPAARQLDFWVGTWDVFNPAGAKVGANVIEKRLEGHLIFENWTSAQGGTGQSFNYYNPDAQSWTQVWVDNQGGIIRKEGNFENGAMRMEGTRVLAGGEVRAFRSTLTPNADGSIRQFIQESTDGGETWNDWFKGRYVRADADADAASDANDSDDTADTANAADDGDDK